jgi:hypothetical protein
MLTVKLAGDSKSMIMAGGELTVADSGDELQKGTANNQHLGPSRPDYFVMETTGSTAELLRYSPGL